MSGVLMDEQVQDAIVVYAHQDVPSGRCVLELEVLLKAGELADFGNKVFYIG